MTAKRGQGLAPVSENDINDDATISSMPSLATIGSCSVVTSNTQNTHGSNYSMPSLSSVTSHATISSITETEDEDFSWNHLVVKHKSVTNNENQKTAVNSPARSEKEILHCAGWNHHNIKNEVISSSDDESSAAGTYQEELVPTPISLDNKTKEQLRWGASNGQGEEARSNSSQSLLTPTTTKPPVDTSPISPSSCSSLRSKSPNRSVRRNSRTLPRDGKKLTVDRSPSLLLLQTRALVGHRGGGDHNNRYNNTNEVADFNDSNGSLVTQGISNNTNHQNHHPTRHMRMPSSKVSSKSKDQPPRYVVRRGV